MTNFESIDVEILRRIRAIIITGVGVFAFGTIGYMVVEKWSFIDSIYMTSITLATVGYGEVHPLGQQGRIFTIFLILFGLGVFGYTISNFTSIVIEGHLTNYFRRKKMEQKIAQLKDHVILCGYGRVGQNVVPVLERENRQFVIIEQRETVYDMLTQSGYFAICGNATEDEMLKKAGIQYAYGLIAALDSDINNLFIVMSARKLNPKLFIVARVEQDSNQDKIIAAGADRVVCPAHIGGYRLAAVMLRMEIANFLDDVFRRKGHDLSLEEMKIETESPFLGKSIRDSNIPEGIKIIGLKKINGKYIVNPDSITVLEEGDILILLGEVSELQKIHSA